jgi:hypothetical protein
MICQRTTLRLRRADSEMRQRDRRFEPLAQLAEHLPFKQRVAGSSPARLTFKSSSVFLSISALLGKVKIWCNFPGLHFCFRRNNKLAEGHLILAT